jgi:hypothetical protein
MIKNCFGLSNTINRKEERNKKEQNKG